MKKETISQRLKQIMIERGLKQIDILKKCDPICDKYGIKRLGSNGLSQYVNGKVEPSQRILSILAEALNVNEVWLMGYDVSKKTKSTFTPLEEFLQTMDYEQIDNLTLKQCRKLLKLIKEEKEQ